jgi:hypothetical protein
VSMEEILVCSGEGKGSCHANGSSSNRRSMSYSSKQGNAD